MYLHMSSHANSILPGYRILILLLLVSGAALLISSASAGAGTGTGVTISAEGDRSYYLGEIVVLKGQNSVSDSTYLFITGPNLPGGGGKLTSPQQTAVSGSPDSFTVVKTKPDTAWEYSFYTANLPYSAGSYTLYAVSKPRAKEQSGDLTTYGTVSIILKKPFILAEISSKSITRGQPFTVTGTAEGIPPEVQIWIFGDNYVYPATTTVNSDANFTFNADAVLSGKLPAGQNYLIVQHPMADNRFNFVISGDFVRNLEQENGTNIFRVTGQGSMQGSGAAHALAAALSDQEAHDTTLTNDTYTIIPFKVTENAASSNQGTAATTTPVRQSIRYAPLRYAPLDALVLIVGIGAWRRR